MSRSYSKARLDHSIKEKWYCYKKVRRYEYRDATEEEMIAMAKKHASKSHPGRHSAPRWFVQLMFNRPTRREENALLDAILAGKVDPEEAIFPRYRKGAWYLWY